VSSPSAEKSCRPNCGKTNRLTFSSPNGVGRTLRARQHTVCLVVVPEALPHRIPIDFSLELHRDVMEKAGSAGPVSYLYRSNRLLPRSHTVEPVRMMLFTL